MMCCIIILPMPVFESTVARVETVHDFRERGLDRAESKDGPFPRIRASLPIRLMSLVSHFFE
jgi:hypothetical protein